MSYNFQRVSARLSALTSYRTFFKGTKYWQGICASMSTRWCLCYFSRVASFGLWRLPQFPSGNVFFFSFCIIMCRGLGRNGLHLDSCYLIFVSSSSPFRCAFPFDKYSLAWTCKTKKCSAYLLFKMRFAHITQVKPIPFQYDSRNK